MDKGRDDLAREALAEKRRFSEMTGAIKQELEEHDDMVVQYQDDIRQLEEGVDETRIIFGDSFTVAITPVPLPPALLLFLSGILGFAAVARRRSAASA